MTAPLAVSIGAGDVVHYTPTPAQIRRAELPAGCREALVMAVYQDRWSRCCLGLLVDAGEGYEPVEALAPYGVDVGSTTMPGTWHYVWRGAA